MFYCISNDKQQSKQSHQETKEQKKKHVYDSLVKETSQSRMHNMFLLNMV